MHANIGPSALSRKVLWYVAGWTRQPLLPSQRPLKNCSDSSYVRNMVALMGKPRMALTEAPRKKTCRPQDSVSEALGVTRERRAIPLMSRLIFLFIHWWPAKLYSNISRLWPEVYLCLYQSSSYNPGVILVTSFFFFNAIPGCWFWRMTNSRTIIFNPRSVIWFQILRNDLWLVCDFWLCGVQLQYYSGAHANNSHCNKTRKQAWMRTLILSYSIASAVKMLLHSRTATGFTPCTSYRLR